MNKNYVLGIGVLGLSLLSSVAVTYATEEKIEEQDHSVTFSHPFDKKEKKSEEKGEFRMEKKAPKDFKELTDEEKAEFEAKKVEMQEKMKTEFQEKLSKGEISQEEYDTFIENLENGKIGCMKAPKDFKELTDEEKAEFEAKKVEMQEKMKTEFQEKLSKGEITQEKYDTFIENLENRKIGCMKAPKDFKELTDEEKAEFEAKKVEMQEKMKTEFQEKLSKGEISQEEYDTFIENLESGKGGCPMEGKRKMGAFKGENNEENTEKGQFKMLKKFGKKLHTFKKGTSEQETE